MSQDVDKFSDVIVEDDNQFRGGGDISIKALAMDQFRRCCTEGSQSISKVSLDGSNQKEKFANSVDMLESVLAEQIMTKKSLKEIGKELKKMDEQLELINQAHNESLEDVTTERGRGQQTTPNTDYIYNNYYTQIYFLYKKRLTLLSRVLAKLNYFDERGESN